MAFFLDALEPFSQQMLHNIADEAVTSSSVFNNTLNYELGQQGFQNQRIINQQNIASQNELAISGQNFQAQQNALNREQNANQFQQGLQSAQHLQDSRFQNLAQLQNSRLGAMQSMNTQNTISNFARGALNFGGGLISAGLQFAQNNQIAALQRQNFDYMTTKASDAFTNAGLPSWLAFSSNNQQAMMNQLPRTSQVFSGNNMMTSTLPGNPMAQAWTGSQSQASFGFGDVPLAQ